MLSFPHHNSRPITGYFLELPAVLLVPLDRGGDLIDMDWRLLPQARATPVAKHIHLQEPSLQPTEAMALSRPGLSHLEHLYSGNFLLALLISMLISNEKYDIFMLISNEKYDFIKNEKYVFCSCLSFRVHDLRMQVA